LIRPTLYDAWHPIRLVSHRGGDMKSYDIVGPVCETGDTFTTQRTLPSAQAGDLVAIMAAGAYGFVMASNYNSRPLPPEILVKDGNYTIIRQRQDIRDILEGDILPDTESSVRHA
jgi:diaminopimelate decarboxylase